MRYILSSLILLVSTFAFSSDLDQDLNQAYNLLDSDLDASAAIAQKILAYSVESNDYFGQVQANFILGYITCEKKEYGVSVIYYLEAIRRAEQADYDKVHKDRISLRKN